ncbi:MAG: rhomboid family intramembrane serine protease [Promethearchaeota archaeon]
MIFLDAERFKEAKITLTLILVNVICFFLFGFALPGEYILALVQINSKILIDYEIWRLVTPIFLHSDLLHLFSNMFALLIFGTTIETDPKISKLEFLLIFFISGLIGNVATLFLLPPNVISLGASGAIFGLIGVVFIMVAIENRSLLPFTLIYIFYFIAASFMPGINIWAHIFGLLGGILCGFVFYYRRKDFTKHY